MTSTSLATVLPTALSAAFYAFVMTLLFARIRAARTAPPRPARRPAVSILKPIAGLHPGLDDDLASFARLDYPAFELLLGFASESDPAVAVARDFLARHPSLEARIVWTRPPDAEVPNPKVAQLIELARAARFDVFVVSDANVRVDRDYLDALAAELERPGVGLCTSVLVARGGTTLGADLDAAQLVAYFAPAVVAADTLGVRPVAVGKSMAMRRADLHTVGGFQGVGGVLAEDDVLASRFRASGMRVALSLLAVESRSPGASVAATFDRYARWTKMRRSISPACAAVEPLASPFVVATAILALARSSLALELWVSALVLQMVGAALAGALLLGDRGLRSGSSVQRDRSAPARLALLEPVRAVMGLGCLAVAWASRTVHWRGQALRLGPGTRLLPPPPAVPFEGEGISRPLVP